MTLKFYNTRTRTKHEFIPIETGKAGVYTCGPTVYHHAHIGNMRSYIFADLLRRTLLLAGYDVNHVMNITDVGHLVSDGDDGEDKMEVGKKREGLNAWQIAEKYTDSFMSHCKHLNIMKPDTVCKATDHIEQQISLVQALQDRGLTYTIDDGVYFDTTKFKSYGEMAKLDIEGLQGGKRIADTGKKSATDFALWKFSPKDAQRDMEWDNPFGDDGVKGFPGWHIECSAMSMHYLGDQFDIHTGGIDHIPVHHTNEIAQAEGATGKGPFVNYWLHNEFLQFGDDVKMSKSKGDTLTVDSLIERGYDPLSYRYLMLTAHYRSPIKVTWESFDVAQKTLNRMRTNIQNLSGPVTETAAYIDEFNAGLFDDLNSAKSLAVIHAVLGDDDLTDGEKLFLIKTFDQSLQLDFFKEIAAVDIPQDIIDLATKRSEAKAAKDWPEADRLRDEISNAGYSVKDTPDGFEILKG